MIILAAVESKSYTNAYPQFAQALASSVTFFQGQDQTAQGQQQGDRSLMTYSAGKYYSYTGGSTMSGSAGTERRIMLCPNGSVEEVEYFVTGPKGVIQINGITFAYEGAAECN